MTPSLYSMNKTQRVPEKSKKIIDQFCEFVADSYKIQLLHMEKPASLLFQHVG